MAKENSNRSKVLKKKKIRRLKGYTGFHRLPAGFACYEEQKKELKRIAKQQGMTLSFYINYLIWQDIMDLEEDS